MFKEVITPLIYDLKDKNNITVTTFDLGMPEELANELATMKEERLIRDFFIIPSNSIFNQYNYLKANLKNINNVNYDLWLTNQEFQTFEQFIQYYVLPKHCYKIVLCHGITYLLSDHAHIAKQFLSLTNYSVKLNKNRVTHVSFNEKIINRIKDSDSVLAFIFNIPQIIFMKLRYKLVAIKKRLKNINSRYFMSIIFFGKIFKNEYYDDITQLGSGRSDYYLFCDDLEAKAHSNIYGSSKVKVVDYPTNGNCNCASKDGNYHIISPLSGVVGVDKIPNQQLKLFLRDFTIISKEVGKNMVLHLRKHPRETGKWPFQLRDYLRANKLNVEVVGTEKSIREVICGYRGMVGLSSCALRDARYSCNNAFIIAFEAVSKFRYDDPKLVYGNGEGIEWINYDGTYNPSIFKNKRFIPPRRISIPEFINAI